MTTTPVHHPAVPEGAFNTPEAKDWFEQLVHQIKIDELQLQTGSADSDKAAFYQNAIQGNMEGMLKDLRSTSTQHFVSQIIRRFLGQLTEKKVMPKKLAFALTPATILAWVEISENDEETEDAIILSEAFVNSYAKEFEFCLGCRSKGYFADVF